MGLFGKRRGSDIIDFTKLQNKSFSEQVKEKSDVIDMRATKSSQFENNFLSSLAGAGVNSDENKSISDSLREARQRNLSRSEIKELKIKIEDNEHKINNLIAKVRELEDKIRRIS